MSANIKNTLCLLFFSFCSQSVFAASTDDIVDGFSEFLIERANANLVYVIERRLKNDKNFQCYFPYTSKKIKKLKIENLFASKNYWENSLNDDLKELTIRSILPQIQPAINVLLKFNDGNKVLELMSYFEYKYKNKSYPINVIGLDWSDELKQQVNGFSSNIADLAKINIDTNLLESLKGKTACELKVGGARQLNEYLVVAIKLKRILKHYKKYGKNLRLTKIGLDRLICKPKNLSVAQCGSIDSSQKTLLAILLKEKSIAKIFEVSAKIEKLEKLYSEFYKLDAKQKLSLTAVGLSLALLKKKNVFTDNDIQYLKKELAKIKASDLTNKQKIVSIMYTIKNKSDKNDSDRNKILDRLQAFLDYKKSYTERSLIGLEYLRKNKSLNFSSYERLHRSVMFFSTIADAKNKDAVKSILIAYTLPPVSFAEKRKQGSGVFISSYLGYAATNYDTASSAERASKGGLFAPVGIEYNYGLDNGGSWSVMLSPIDMAYPINLKLSGIKEEIDLNDIIAPSLTVAYGFEDYPLNIGLGYQRGRTLGDIGKAEDSFLLFISFDMPLFRLY